MKYDTFYKDCNMISYFVRKGGGGCYLKFHRVSLISVAFRIIETNDHFLNSKSVLIK